MRIDTTDAISKALAAANKLVAPRSYVLGGVDHRETVYWTIPEANTTVSSTVCDSLRLRKGRQACV
ncbi:hypothetical protein HBI25_251750 [Parastagonospora nodorum]|nr:hypothetical protein HBH54_252050 [Parastagonospora nodorum]KAH4122450.1 hypothetical protein HBH45_251990 [Parastagonospora nodorum]KAH5392187.1 hypothetical protein HBI47_253480 [Parastagonospora nodorum]KAH5538393.1 hypothetical protein HBI25_251750 [Parastagonospora nodorum]KAH5619443.1 hypothetical protein HBI51_252450 [Parastagonospora nodorum]